MSTILVYKKAIFNISETFVYRQVLALTEKHKVYVAGYKINNNFPATGFTTIQLRKTLFKKEYHLLNKLAGVFLLKKKSLIAFLQLYRIIKQKKIAFIHAHYGTGGLEALKAARFTKTPLIVSFHGYDASSKMKNPGYVKRLPALFAYAAAIVVSSTHMIKSLGLDRWKEKVHFVPYGIDAGFFKSPQKFENQNLILLHSGRVVEKKGVPDLIIVFSHLLRKHSNICLHIVGDGEELERCKLLVQDLSIPEEKIKFHGAQTQQSVKAFMGKADIFILNSRTAADGNMEGLPNAVLEAMSMEKAVVSTFHAGIPDAITNGYNGYLVEENDNTALESAIEKLLLHGEERARVGKNARQTVLEKFTEAVMQKKLTELFTKLNDLTT